MSVGKTGFVTETKPLPHPRLHNSAKPAAQHEAYDKLMLPLCYISTQGKIVIVVGQCEEILISNNIRQTDPYGKEKKNS